MGVFDKDMKHCDCFLYVTVLFYLLIFVIGYMHHILYIVYEITNLQIVFCLLFL